MLGVGRMNGPIIFYIGQWNTIKIGLVAAIVIVH